MITLYDLVHSEYTEKIELVCSNGYIYIVGYIPEKNIFDGIADLRV